MQPNAKFDLRYTFSATLTNMVVNVLDGLGEEQCYEHDERIYGVSFSLRERYGALRRPGSLDLHNHSYS